MRTLEIPRARLSSLVVLGYSRLHRVGVKHTEPEGEMTTSNREKMDLLKAKFASNREKMDLMMAEPKRLVENYFKTFDANRADLVNLYREESGMNFSGQMIRGKEAIVAKLASLQRSQHQINGISCLPSSETGGVLALADGYLWLDGKPDAYLFYQSFCLLQEPEGSYYIDQQIWATRDFNNRWSALA